MRVETDNENIRDLSPSQVRIPSDLKEKIRLAAKKNRHSMSAEIVARLEASFEERDKDEISGELKECLVSRIPEDHIKAFLKFEEMLREFPNFPSLSTPDVNK